MNTAQAVRVRGRRDGEFFFCQYGKSEHNHYFAPPQILNFEFDADPAFHPDADLGPNFHSGSGVPRLMRPVFRIRIRILVRIHQIHMFWAFLIRIHLLEVGMDPDPSVIKQK
jgi:hypothetical protein